MSREFLTSENTRVSIKRKEERKAKKRRKKKTHRYRKKREKGNAWYRMETLA